MNEELGVVVTFAPGLVTATCPWCGKTASAADIEDPRMDAWLHEHGSHGHRAANKEEKE